MSIPQEKKKKTLFFGTSEFAVPALTALLDHGYDIASVITNPDEPKGRKRIIAPPPVKICARKRGLLVLQPEKIKENKEMIALLSDMKPDVAVVAAYGKIIPKEIIDVPKHGTLNLHPSLLPRWRGPSPIQYAILGGDEETGVTLMQLDEIMDHGPIIAHAKIKIQKTNITYPKLRDTLAEAGAKLLVATLPSWLAGEITPTPQDDTKATFSKKLKKEDGRIDWKKPAQDIERMVRAFNPWPGTWTMWPHDGKIYRIRIEKAEALREDPPRGSPGYAWKPPGYPLAIKTGHGSLSIEKITMEGKKTMSAEEFLRGYASLLGTSLI